MTYKLNLIRRASGDEVMILEIIDTPYVDDINTDYPSPMKKFMMTYGYDSEIKQLIAIINNVE